MKMRRLQWFVLVCVLIGVAAGVPASCTCGASTIECDIAADCEVRTLPPDLQCSDDVAYWECIDTICVALCSSCGADLDCDDLDVCTTDTCNVSDICENEAIAGCCTSATDCVDEPWPPGVECSEADGHWECTGNNCSASCEAGSECETDEDCTETAGCQGGVTLGFECVLGTCKPVCCNTDAECLDWAWTEACEGRFECTRFHCAQLCDDPLCGNGTCDTIRGEGISTCPTDCVVACTTATDCNTLAWPLPCNGYYTCETDTCGYVCDYSRCGDGACDSDESGFSCREDCLRDKCLSGGDCLHRGWALGCDGHWNCLGGVLVCNAECGGACGDDICDPVDGESGLSCPGDCVAGGCTFGVMDCFEVAWDAAVGTACPGDGHWSCDGATSACDRVCEDGSGPCGDGVCDPRGGESPDACPDDCASYGCSAAADCEGTPLPTGCASGAWQCYRQVCWPDC